MAIETEAQRQFYLAMAGIHCWYARAPQPGAAASPAFDFGEAAPAEPQPEALPAMPSPVRQDKQRQRKAGMASVRGLMADAAPVTQTPPAPPSTPPASDRPVAETRAPVAKDAPASAEPKTAPVDTAPAESVPTGKGDRQVVTAHWGFWCAGPWLLVSALSADASHQLQESLARNILKALGAEEDSSLNLQWPVFNNPAVAGNDRAGLRTLLEDLRRDWPDQRLIALGLCQGEDWPDRREWLAGALGEPVVDFEYSLPALASDPGRKRALWSRLRPLVNAGD